MCVQAQDSAADADRAVTDAEKTQKRAADLDSQVDRLRKKIQGEGNLQRLVASTFTGFKCFWITGP